MERIENKKPSLHRGTLAAYTLLLGIFMAVGFVSCNRGPKMIPEDEMRAIIRDELVSQAIAAYSTDAIYRPLDSLDLHSEILEPYGYTLEDFKYTVREMSLRKSNPLVGILRGVEADIKVEAIAVEVRYKAKMKADSISVKWTADTVYRSDKVISGKWDHRFTYAELNALGDSVVPAALYWLEFDYSTGGHAQTYTKSVRIRRVPRETIPGNRRSGSEGTVWIGPSKDTIPFQADVVVGENVKQLYFTFRDSQRAGMPPDTCYIRNIRLIRTLPKDRARDKYNDIMSGIKPIEEIYYERYIDSVANFSGTLPPYLGR